MAPHSFILKILEEPTIPFLGRLWNHICSTYV